MGDGQENFSPELLRAYYRRVFPAELMCRWLGYGTGTAASAQSRLLRRREFSFTTGDDVYIRYLSYEDAAAFRKDLCDKLPFKIDLGAIFSAPPSEHKKFKVFAPVQRELIFDIDLTDYDFLGAPPAQCPHPQCPHPPMSVASVSTHLAQDFGFKHLLWVYSGRRGIHCWVSDERARNLSNEGRSAVADYMSLQIKDGRMAVQVPMHPTLAAIHRDVIKPFLEGSMLSPDGQGLLETEAGWAALCAMLGDKELEAQLVSEFGKKNTGAERWEHLKRTLERKKMSRIALELEFSLAYPRLDVNVSKSMNHLLKSPWCAHPKTGRVCVCFDANKVDDFVPSKFRPMALFAKFVRALEADERGAQVAAARALAPPVSF
ncbi:hypothetical protein T492DRAFT_942901 [Pavlovales sp. CCMP2436]|nr:hypothetical protein T492DRAFT_942901 [Pavlovales sp. CCMP2436]